MNLVRRMNVFHRCGNEIKWDNRELIEIDLLSSYNKSTLQTDVTHVNVYKYTGTCLTCGDKRWSIVRINKDLDIPQPFDSEG